ncbi:uncharacterized protein L969DRAFT_454461 [Mixia osmundae IAM 14324]|uniref:Uncharacterized protein n=1 Tax=Mixia osmundae (strain CBS 9802 / IAM 14324 / JCM 22182 / KY 12970) TaxID=764103 RepID=G7DVK5_MIXOS|nr:uncharacterized protein L969DRAFT_454461 [Mixia osmundae IAM 14324]KEI39542.1 hypothetical protein L969DRAFT_454461 [Mixia osmundae IAM 14324]GAA94615.1 hypothetical protein E5Q_01267 [Mixia osmundae IAM 14324]
MKVAVGLTWASLASFGIASPITNNHECIFAFNIAGDPQPHYFVFNLLQNASSLVYDAIRIDGLPDIHTKAYHTDVLWQKNKKHDVSRFTVNVDTSTYAFTFWYCVDAQDLLFRLDGASNYKHAPMSSFGLTCGSAGLYDQQDIAQANW